MDVSQVTSNVLVTMSNVLEVMSILLDTMKIDSEVMCNVWDVLTKGRSNILEAMSGESLVRLSCIQYEKAKELKVGD